MGQQFSDRTKRRFLYAGSGNNYSVPPAVLACVQKATDAEAKQDRLAQDDYIDSIFALDLDTGTYKWVRRFEGADTFTAVCVRQPNRGIPCPSPAGPDYDFGSAPNLFTTLENGRRTELLGAGQKSGVYWALNPATGATVWATQVGPGGDLGGIEWGSAVDREHVFVAINNVLNTPYQLQPAGTITVNAGSWAALDGKTGKFLWQVPATGKNPQDATMGAGALGAVSAANGVMYAGSMSGDMVALNAETGALLWKFTAAGSVV